MTARAVTVVPRDAIEADANRLAGAATATLDAAVVREQLRVLRRREIAQGSQLAWVRRRRG